VSALRNPDAAGSGPARSAGRSAAVSGTPRPVTRGESPVAGKQVAKVDWLNATFPAPRMSVEGFVGLLGRMLGRPVSAVEGHGMLGFESRVELWAHVASKKAPMGFLAFGGESQNGRWLLQFTGAGCGLVDDWEGIQDLLESLDAKITRVDLAVDFLDGEHTVDDAVRMHQAGRFAANGRPPTTETAGDWLDLVRGRTLYVGKAKNGKMLRVYEKGRQLGDLQSDWVRFEVQLGNRDRTIPLDVLTRCDRYFGGAYPALADLLEQAGEQIATERKGGEVTLAHLVYHMKRCYGKVFDVLSNNLSAPNTELVQEVRVVGIPRRLKPSSLCAGLTWAQLLVQIRK
jgi:phage replication initiation protein